MKERDKRKELLGCFLYLSRLIAIFAAVGGVVKGLMAGNTEMMMWAVVAAGLYYLLVWLGVKLVLKGIKKSNRTTD